MSSEVKIVALAGLRALFESVVRRPVATTMVFLAALVFGVVSYQRLPVELMPDISYPTVTVRTTFDGAAPQEVESQISRLIEAQVATLDGLVRLESRSRAGQSDVILGFDWGADMSVASQSIREKIQTVFLPDGADRPLILRYDPSLDPFLRLALSLDPDAAEVSSDAALYTLREIAEQEVQRALEGMAGVAAVRVRGGLQREIRVEIDREKLTARRLTIDDVRTGLASANVNLSGGSILEGDTEYLVRTLNELRTLDEMRLLRVRRSDGVSVPLTDVATFHETHVEREVVSHLDGVEAVEIEVFKEADANVVEVAARVKDRLLREGTASLPSTHPMFQPPGVIAELPEGLVLEVLDDQAAFIGAAIDNLLSTALLGALFAVVVLFLFLRSFPATVNIGLSIPISVVIAFAPLYLLGVSLNLMSLGGLALGIGMLVDNAVVVLESIQRYVEEGESRARAAVLGTADVASAVTASTLTTVAVFFPITFVDGVAGELFGDLAVAVVASLLASLAVALFLVPTLAGLQLPTLAAAQDEGFFGRVAAVRAGHAGFGSLFGALITDATGPARVAIGQTASGLGLTRLAYLVPAESARPARWWRWLLVPFSLFKIVIVFIAASIAAALSLALILSLAAGALVVAGVRATLGRLAFAFARAWGRGYDALAGRYLRALPGALRRPGRVAGVAVVALVAAVGVGMTLGAELIPEVHQGRLVVTTALPVGTPLPVNVQAIASLERRVRSHPDVRTVYATYGSDRGADAEADEGEHSAVLRVLLHPSGGGLFSEGAAAREARIVEDLRRLMATYPRVDARITRPPLFELATPIEVVVFGHDLDDLRTAGDRTVALLESMPGLRDVSTSLARGYPEVQIRYDRERLRRLGLDPNTVATRVRDQVLGVRATSIQRSEQRVDVRVQLIPSQRASITDLRAINVNPDLVPPIPLDTVATLVEAEGPSEIRRVDQRRAVVVGAGVAGFDLGTIAAEIGEELGRVAWPSGTEAQVAGQSQELQTSLRSMQFALLLAVFLVYIIMASTFENVVQPMVILLSVPLAAVGVALTLWVAGLSISVVVLIGTIVLAGVVVNNAIVFVDTINQRRAMGLPRAEAILEAGRLRLRPILITTVTTVLGLFPLSLGLGEGAEIQQPLAITVIGGLISSTLLTLVVIPVAYRLLDRAANTFTSAGGADRADTP